MTVMGDAAMNRLSDRGSIPLSSIEKNLERSRFFCYTFTSFIPRISESITIE